MNGPEDQQVDSSVGNAPGVSKPDDKPTEVNTRSQISKAYQLRTEIPAIPNVESITFAQVNVDDKSAGNFGYRTNLLEKGYIGYWRSRDTTAHSPTTVEIDPVLYLQGINDTLHGVLTRYVYKKSDADTNTQLNRVATMSARLAIGVVVATYLKFRNILLTECPDNLDPIHTKKPRVNDNLELPAGFAFALQQFGTVNVADTLNELIYVPKFPDQGHEFGIPTHLARWSPYMYAEAVTFAKDLGMKFSMLNLKQKQGTAWWLFRQDYEEVPRMFTLRCPLPESNFTKSMVITHCLWLNGQAENPSRPFANAETLGNANYGYMLRAPHIGINISAYDAIASEAPDVLNNV